MLELLILKGWSADKVKDRKGGKEDSILTISLSNKMFSGDVLNPWCGGPAWSRKKVSKWITFLE